jgi:hypothetical protein
VPSLVFCSVSGFPFVSVTDGAPLAREPPAIEIFAPLRVSLTSLKKGSDAGKTRPQARES